MVNSRTLMGAALLLRASVFAWPTSTVVVTEYTYTTATEAASPTIALANGILANIDIQVHELANVQALLSSITGSATLNTAEYLATKTSLLAIQASGTSIRANNQAIAPSGNAAIPGLSTVAAAQASEIALASALSGNLDVDAALLEALVTMVQSGTAKNAANRLQALGGTLL